MAKNFELVLGLLRDLGDSKLNEIEEEVGKHRSWLRETASEAKSALGGTEAEAAGSPADKASAKPGRARASSATYDAADEDQENDSSRGNVRGRGRRNARAQEPEEHAEPAADDADGMDADGEPAECDAPADAEMEAVEDALTSGAKGKRGVEEPVAPASKRSKRGGAKKGEEDPAVEEEKEKPAAKEEIVAPATRRGKRGAAAKVEPIPEEPAEVPTTPASSKKTRGRKKKVSNASTVATEATAPSPAPTVGEDAEAEEAPEPAPKRGRRG
eukprot:CAMPEP_0182883176 /NCGR_PEP_ID=MMETSP0034_2-20130328/18230_1 /TAXON_ID=156128 /ORGANISM="Nephroselmis pyriformis, Strain CCMP717" /LENGTH=271 /DNA_ID=CAMNT_0025016309 /DNA_START=168 /DNA_END=979 /DNA_ORIENTATION=-